MPPKSISLRTIKPQTTYLQTIEIFKADTLRRIPTKSCKTVLIYYWEPDINMNKNMKQWNNLLKRLKSIAEVYFPKLEFVPMIPALTIPISTPNLSIKYRKDVYYNANTLLDHIEGSSPLLLKGKERKNKLENKNEVLTTGTSGPSTFAKILITSVPLVVRSTTTLTAGLARRLKGVACYSTSHNADETIFIHEFAHLLGLHHCTSDPSCIMIAGGVDTAWIKTKSKVLSTQFCTDCQTKINISCSFL